MASLNDRISKPFNVVCRVGVCAICFPLDAQMNTPKFFPCSLSAIPAPKALNYHIKRQYLSMGGFLSLEWRKRAIEETRALCTGLFVTAVLARVIANSGFDARPTPVLSTSFNSEVLSFLCFAVRSQIEFRFEFLLTICSSQFVLFTSCLLL